MKKLIIFVASVLMLTSCTTLKVTTEEGVRADYKRYFTGLSISEMTITPNDDGSVSIEIKGLKSDVSEALGVLNEVIEKIPVE